MRPPHPSSANSFVYMGEVPSKTLELYPPRL